MKLEHDFTVPAPVDEAWKVLLDVERVAPCMPGATLLTVDGDEFTGTVKVKVGPIQVTYKGKARFTSLDEAGHRAVIEASGKEARGTGTAAATVTTVLESASASTTRVRVETDLNVTGRPAQFGRGVMAEVGGKLIGQFASCLAEELSAPSTPATGSADEPTPAAEPAEPATEQVPVQSVAAPDLPPTAAGPVEAAPAPPAPLPEQSTASISAPAGGSGPRQVAPPRRPAEAIDLLDVAGGSIVKRLAPVAAVLAVVLAVILWRRRRS